MEQLRKELIERYEATGKIGFVKPKSLQEALSLIDTVISVYDENETPKEKEEVVINLHDITERMKNFFNDTDENF